MSNYSKGAAIESERSDLVDQISVEIMDYIWPVLCKLDARNYASMCDLDMAMSEKRALLGEACDRAARAVLVYVDGS
jgi:hypothetical protein